MDRPVKTRRRLGPDERRGQIMRATVMVVADRGYSGASTTAIADAAGVAKGLLWHYFSDAADLMEQTARHILATLDSIVAADIDLDASVPEVIRAALERAALLTRTHPAELDAVDQIVRSLRNADGTARLTVDDLDDTYTRMERLFARGQDEGTLRVTDLRTMAVVYEGAVDAMLDHLRHSPDVDPRAYAATVADIVLGGMATH